MKVFISVPMNGRTDEEIDADTERIFMNYQNLTINNSEFLETFFDDEDFEGVDYENMPLAYLSKSLDVLAQAEIAIFAKGWEKARGCRIEHQCAVDYGIPIIEED